MLASTFGSARLVQSERGRAGRAGRSKQPIQQAIACIIRCGVTLHIIIIITIIIARLTGGRGKGDTRKNHTPGLTRLIAREWLWLDRLPEDAGNQDICNSSCRLRTCMGMPCHHTCNAVAVRFEVDVDLWICVAASPPCERTGICSLHGVMAQAGPGTKFPFGNVVKRRRFASSALFCFCHGRLSDAEARLPCPRYDRIGRRCPGPPLACPPPAVGTRLPL